MSTKINTRAAEARARRAIEADRIRLSAAKGAAGDLDRMIARRVAKGATEAESRALLAELTSTHSGDNLAAALVYWRFATPRAADTFAAAF